MAAESTQLIPVVSHDTSSAGALGTLGINAGSFVAQLIHFTIILFIMWRWVYRPLLKKMDERSKKIADGLALSETAERHLAEALHEKDQLLRDAQAEYRRLLDEASVKAEASRKEKLDQAKIEIETLIAEAKERIAAERAEAFRALRQDVANLVVIATQKVVKNLDEQTRRGLVTQALKDLEKEKML